MKVPGGREAGEDAGPWSMDGLTVAAESCPRELLEFLSNAFHNEGKDRDYDGVLQSADTLGCYSSICGMWQCVWWGKRMAS